MLIGVDWGGTKIEGIAMSAAGEELARVREATPRHDYPGCIAMIRDIVARLEAETGGRGRIGIGIPGSLEPETRLGKGASSTWLLGRPVERDLREGWAAISASRTTPTASPRPRPSTGPARGRTSSSR